MLRLSGIIRDDPSCDTDGRLAEDVYCATKECGYNLRGVDPGGACPECGKAIAESIEENRFKDMPGLTLYRFGPFARFICIFFGVMTAAGAFLMAESGPDSFLVDWQSGDFRHYVMMLLGAPAARPFYPFLLLSFGSLIALTVRPVEAARFTVVRIGVYTGVVLGVQYTLILFGSMAGVVGLLIVVLVTFMAAGPFLATLLFPRYARKWGWTKPKPKPQPPQKWVRFTLWAIGLSLAVVFVAGGGWVLTVILSPIWFMLVYASLLVRLINSRAIPSSREAGWWAWLIGWLGSYAVAWGGSIAMAIDVYRSLPTQPPPDCYVCTAAARGHRRVVGAARIVTADGTVYFVNRQMRVLKASELAMAVTMPRMHRMLRVVYDCAGSRLASQLRWRWLADLAYLIMTPIEMLARTALRLVCPEADRRIESLYRSRADR